MFLIYIKFCKINLRYAYFGLSPFLMLFVFLYFLVTVRKNPICKNATENEVVMVIKQWFRTAGDRDGGRSKRNINRMKMM